MAISNIVKQSCSSRRIWQQLQPELAEHIARYLNANDIACTLRLVNKAAAEQFRGPLHTMVRLSQPVPTHAFATQWNRPGAVRCLTYKRRSELLRLTAVSGCLENLQTALAVTGCLPTPALIAAAAEAGRLTVCHWLHEHGCPWDATVTATAAKAGQLHVLSWLLEAGCPCGEEALYAAASTGQQAACELLVSTNCPWSFNAVEAAAQGGHVSLMEWLLQREQQLGGPPDPHLHAWRTVIGAAAGCDLATLQRLHAELLEAAGAPGVPGAPQQAAAAAAPAQPGSMELPVAEVHAELVSAAAGSPTPDWAAKVDWLERRGYTLDAEIPDAVMKLPDAQERLAWLRSRGFRADAWTLVSAASNRRLAVCEQLLAEESRRYTGAGVYAAWAAAGNGDLAMLRLLHRHGVRMGSQVTISAASGGYLDMMAWLLEEVPSATGGRSVFEHPNERALPRPHLLRHAAEAGHLDMMAWLAERLHLYGDGEGEEARKESGAGGAGGGGGGGRQYADGKERMWSGAAGGGCEAALEWLAERGWPVEVDGDPYFMAASNGDLATLRCLRRLGCPWGPAGRVICQVLKGRCDTLPPSSMLRVLNWLREAGCPADWEAALAAARQSHVSAEILAWLQERAAGAAEAARAPPPAGH